MKISWFLIFYILPLALSQISCPNYLCSPTKLDSNTCILYESNTFLLQPCKDNYVCPPLTSADSSQCQPKPSPSLEKSWPGESCQNNSTCAYGHCEKSICKGKSLNETCSISDECEPKLRCLNGICQELLSESSKGCNTDYDCENHCGCENHQCVRYLSKYEGDSVANCINNSSMICGSTMCYEEYCLAFLQNDKEIPTVCKSDEDCASSHYDTPAYPFKFYQTCQCGINSLGNAYCSLFPGDEPMNNYLDWLNYWFYSRSIQKCNTVRRTSLNCIKTWWKAKYYTTFAYILSITMNYPQIQENDNCVEKIYNQAYISARNSYEKTNNHYKLSIPALILTAFLL
ncbi:unnamed protein product [Blepharisma stoltei]|uniref:Dickkopf N-terminal cysteine-rich domain-containing protein n=1 Tax=Blepharisma stoltei TaxID=1481888 RepID=A0AAU9IK52_9CILI|nr:unnamed protein product [Blepharisma stoltei]